MSAPVDNATAASREANEPPMTSRPPTTAASVTAPDSFALNRGSTAPVTGFNFTSPRRATPFTTVKEPPTYREPPEAVIAHTSPLIRGAKEVIAPFAVVKANIRYRVTARPPGAETEVNEPPAYMTPRYSASL